MQAQAQAEQGAHVAQEAGEGCGVQVDPLGSHAPPLGFLHGPQQVHSHCFEQEVEAHSKGGQEECGVKISLHAGAVDPSLLGDNLSNKNTWGKNNRGSSIKLSKFENLGRNVFISTSCTNIMNRIYYFRRQTCNDSGNDLVWEVGCHEDPGHTDHHLHQHHQHPQCPLQESATEKTLRTLILPNYEDNNGKWTNGFSSFTDLVLSFIDVSTPASCKKHKQK